MMQALPDAVLAFNKAGHVVFGNDAAKMLFDASEKMLMESTLADLLGAAGPVMDAVAAVVKNGQSIVLYDVNIRDKYAHRVNIRPMEDSGLYLLIVNLHSLQLATEWTNKARHALRPAQLMARTLAHEIKNPLAGIQAAAQLLDKVELKADDRELVGLIARETERIMRLVEKVDIFGDSAQERFRNVNIHEVLGHVTQVARTAYGPGVQIEERYDPSLPDLHGDFDYLVQAQMNIVKNAAEALRDSKGRISIRTFYDNAAAHHPESHEKLPLCIEIEDDGQGITEAALRKIFDPYFTTKTNGQGLGLAIVSKIIDDHGGAIDVKSQPGRTIFRLSFPVGSKKP